MRGEDPSARETLLRVATIEGAVAAAAACRCAPPPPSGLSPHADLLLPSRWPEFARPSVSPGFGVRAIARARTLCGTACSVLYIHRFVPRSLPRLLDFNALASREAATALLLHEGAR